MILERNVIPSGKGWQTPTLALAFSELKSLLNKRFGAVDKKRKTSDLIIKFDVKSYAHGFSLMVSEDKLLFSAPSEIEILYAVYDFAEEFLGFCFFEPGVDRLSDRSVKIELKNGILLANRQPVIKRRGFVQEFPFTEDNYLIGDWMVKNKMNYLMTWMKYYDEVPQKMKDFYHARGIEIESGHHNFNYWIPPEKYYSSHPDFFAVINGKRINPTMSKSTLLLSEQLCTTNPCLRAEIVKNMVAYCKAHPEIKTISLLPNDGFGWCECESCSKFYDKNAKGSLYSLSEHVYKANKIYHDMFKNIFMQLKKQLPDISLTLCSYVNYSVPSKGFKLEKNMAVHFAPYWRCINHRINDKTCHTNSHYAADLDKWLAIRNGGDVNICEYYMGINLYISLPVIHHEDIFDEIAFYGEKNVDGLITQFHIPHWTAYGLNFYMMGKAAYGADKKSAVQAAMEKIFGPDWKLADKFYAAMKKLVLSAKTCHIPYPYSLFSRTALKQYQSVNEMAKRLLEQAPKDKFRKELVIWTEYLIRFKELFDRYHYKRDVQVRDVEALSKWIHRFKSSRVFVHPKVDMLMGAWINAIKTGKDWYHFNLEWEDEYIRKHKESLK